MNAIAVDYSFSVPSPAALKAAGVGLVIRYTTGKKALTVPEAQALRAADIGIALVHETSIDRVNTGGVNGGKEDMAQAGVFGARIGYPTSGVVFFACDTAAVTSAARAYFRGVKSVSGSQPIGWYGGMQSGLQLLAKHLVDVVWVANAASWSGYRHWDDMAPAVRANPNVSMLQHLDHPLPGIAASTYDYDEVLHPFPAWGVSLPAPSPSPVPPTSTTTDLGDVTLKHTVINPVTLDSKGDGYIAAPKGTSFVQVQAGPEPTPDHGYIPRPTASLTADGKFIVLIGGAPGEQVIVNVFSL